LETNGRALVEATGLIPGRKHLVFEEGTQSAWLYEILSPHVEEAVVAGVSKSRGQKDDQRDAYGLAEKLRTGTLDKRIFKSPGQFTMLRELARTHQMIGRDLVRVQVRLKSRHWRAGSPRGDICQMLIGRERKTPASFSYAHGSPASLVALASSSALKYVFGTASRIAFAAHDTSLAVTSESLMGSVLNW